MRDVTRGDLPAFFEHQMDPEAARMAALASRGREAFMAHWTGILGDACIIKRTVLVDGRVAGNVVSFEQDGEREVGYWLGSEFWGRGVATEALSRFLGLERGRPLHARVAKGNAASIRVLEKCGFEVSGEEVEHSGTAGGGGVGMLVLILRARK